MESTPPSSKRMKNKNSKKEWKTRELFSSDLDLINKYLQETSRKMINTPKVISFKWLKEQKLMEVRRLSKVQMLRRFLEMSGKIYPDLVKVFYTNL